MVESDAFEEDFKAYWERFAAHLEQLGRSPFTIKNYRTDLKAFAQWLRTSGQVLSSLTKVTNEIMQYQEFLLTQQNLKANSVNRRMSTLKNFYTWLHQTEGLSNKYPLHIPPLLEGVSVKGVAPLSQVEQRSLLEVVQQDQNLRDRAILQLLLCTGIRVGELCQLRWEDIEIEDKQGQMLVKRAKGYRNRRLVLPSEVCAALLDLGYQAHAGSQTPVFLGQRGVMTPRGVQEVVKRYARSAGLEKLTPHRLRLTYLTRLLEQGVHPRTISELTGASAEMLLHYYEKPLSLKE